MTTRIIKTNLSALALAAAAFTTTALLADSASALGLANQGHGPVVTGTTPIKQPTKPTLGGIVSCRIGTGCITPQKPPTGVVIPPRQGFPVGALQPPTTGVTIPPRQGFPVGGGNLPPKPPITGGGNPPPHKGGSGGQIVSCHPGTGCTVTGGDRDGDHDRDHDHDYDRDHDHDYGYYRWYRNWGYYPYWNWSLPPVYSAYGVDSETCTYEYKWESTYVPGYGLRRALVKVCATD